MSVRIGLPQKYLEELIRAHQQLGSLHTNDWTKQPLPPTLTMAAWQHVGGSGAGKASASSSSSSAQSAFDRSRLKRKFVWTACFNS